MTHEEIRRAIKEAGVNWEPADEPPVEAQSMLGYLPSEGVPPLDEQERLGAEQAEEALGAGRVSYPPKFDGRRFATEVKNQASCGSCVAFAACGTVESSMAVEHKVRMDLSEAYLFYCVAEAKQGRRCDGEMGGWYPKKALDVFASGGGVPDEASFPYKAGDQKCAVKKGWENKAVKVQRWAPLDKPAQMKDWISKHGAALGSMKVYEDFQLYKSGIYKYVTGDVLGGHAICVVGYNDPEGYWLIKNSWTTGWGEDGYVRMAYGQCGIDSGMLGVEGVKLPKAAFRQEAGAVPLEAA